MTAIDYLLIGHITSDLIPGGHMVGGTVSYSAVTAQAMGCQTAVLTSCHPQFDGLSIFQGIEVVNISSEVTSTFENVYTPNGRIQTLHSVATSIHTSHLPAAWHNPAIVHLAPLTNEVDPDFVHQFPNSLICATPQGWLRRWDANGHISIGEWANARQILAHAHIVILSKEEVPDVRSLWNYWEWSNQILVLTGGPQGCIVFHNHTATHIPADPIDHEVDPTGAGDIFATSFFIRYAQTKDPINAARFANHIAGFSVTQKGLPPFLEKIQTIVSQYE
jgi:sugar/nucleoside kinase (ribokinase family)